MAKDNTYDELYKVGDTCVGKTNLLSYLTYNKSEERLDENGVAKSFRPLCQSTVGVEFATHLMIHPDGTRIKFQIWDTAGQERYRAIANSHYRRANGALLVYEVDEANTFKSAENYWLQEILAADINDSLASSIMLVGNKTDMENVEVSEEEHISLAKRCNLLHKRTSAKTGDNVLEAFEELFLRIYNEEKKHGRTKGNASTTYAEKEISTKIKLQTKDSRQNLDRDYCC